MPSRRRAPDSPKRLLPEKVHAVSVSIRMNDNLNGESAGSLLTEAVELLSAAGINEPRSEASLLLRELLRVSKAWLMAHPEAIVSPDQQRRYVSSVERRAAHEPAAYIIGHREFFGLDLEVGPSVLIPRPETEMLVELAIDACERLLPAKGRDLVAADLGTGSGAVAIALAVRRPAIRIVAVDASQAALEVAMRNAERHRVMRGIEFRIGDLLEGVDERLDLLVANLPYVPSDEVDRLMPEVGRYEPRAALDGGPDGTMLIQRAMEQARGIMEAPATLLFEIGEGQGMALSESARSLYPGADIRVIRDYTGLERVLSIDIDSD